MHAVLVADYTVSEPVAADIAVVYAAHGEFVWASLQRMGIRGADLHDVLQEVFVVVQQRLHSFEHRSSMRTWLFGIALRVAAAHRRRAYVQREQPEAGAGDDAVVSGESPEEAASRVQSRAQLAAILDELDPERRAVFVMFEVDELSCDEIAATLGVKVGTVYSRLHRARKDVEKAAARWRAREAGRARR